MAQEQRQELVRATAMADIQQDMVRSEQGVEIASLQAKAEIQRANGEAQATRLTAAGEADAVRKIGQAKAEVYRSGVEALGESGFTAVQLMQIVGERNVQVVPEVAVSNGNGSASGLMEGLLGMLLRKEVQNGHEG